MNYPRLYSIAEITENDCYRTGGSKPVRVLCNDFKFYICKYFPGEGPSYSLFNEYIAACFLKVWHLPIPHFAIIQIQNQHIQQIRFPFHFFERPCFGSLFNNKLTLVDKFYTMLSFPRKEIRKITESFLKIGLFDIWLSNEDRNFNNYNLLFDSTENLFIPIDHVQIFNGNNLDKEPYLISSEESILTAPLTEHLFSQSLQQNPQLLRSIVEIDFERNIRECHVGLEQILNNSPPEWRIDKKFVRSRLSVFFSESWIKECKLTYNLYLQISVRR